VNCNFATKVVRNASRVLAVTVIALHASLVCAGTTSDSAVSFSGYVTDSSGVDGIDGAVVSVEWHVVPSNPQKSTPSKPTVLAVWQARTDEKGAFRIPEERITLPRGMAPAPDAFPRLQVFAVGHEPYRVSGLGRGVSLGKGGRISIKWPEDVTLIRLIYAPGSLENINEQFEAWYAELTQAVRQEVWPRGEKQALASYQPLMGLVSDSCFRYRLFNGTPLPACERVMGDFALREPTIHWTPVARPAAAAEPQESIPLPTVIGAPADIDFEGMPQKPPEP
jgi:hypothetical protein